MDGDDEWNDGESGPFCRHWGELGTCDRLCVCRHTCASHDGDECNGCSCEKWRDADDDITIRGLIVEQPPPFEVTSDFVANGIQTRIFERKG